MSKIFRKGKKGNQLTAGLVSILAIIGVIAIILFAVNYNQKTTKLTITSPQSRQQSQSPPPVINPPPAINLVDKTTATFSSWDFYVKSTNAGSGHRALNIKSKEGQDKFVGTQVNDDATLTLAPGDTFKVLLGNTTLNTEFTSGTTYYPTYVTGTIPDVGAFTIGAGQYLTAGASQITFTYKNTQGTVGAAQSLGTSDDKTVSWVLQPNANTCVGNPDTGGKNIVTYVYNASGITSIQQYDLSGNEEFSVPTPIGAQATLAGVSTSYSKISFEFPVVCGPGQVDRKVRLKTGTAVNPASTENVNMTVSDVTWGFNTNTFEIIKGYQNNNAVDLGMTDYVFGGLIVS